MHYGSIHGNTAAARVYDVLRDCAGDWIGGMELTIAAKTTAVSTRISEIRRQLSFDERIETKQNGRGFFYRYMKI